MRLRAIVVLVGLVLLVAPIAQAQEIYTYISHWRLPRASFQAASEFNEKTSAPGFEKLVADGAIIHWGIDEPFVHSPTGHTHGTWFAATSMEAIDKAMASFPQGNNPIPGASEAHHDHLLRSLAHGGKTSNVRNGFARTIIMEVKSGMNEDWARFARGAYQSVFDALVADGTVLLWEISTDAIHAAGNPQQSYIWYVTADAAGLDKVAAALEKNASERPGPISALRAASDREGHRDGLARVHFQHK